MESLQEYMDYILPYVKECGKIILESNIRNFETKSADYDLVTVYDRKVEEILIGKIRERYPNHKFIAEEETSLKNEASILTDDPTWIIDPIDGTTNFVHQFYISGISVALAINKEEVLGIIYDPFTNELFTALKNQGAYCNGMKITTSGITEIGKSVFCGELSMATRDELRDLQLIRLKYFSKVVQGIRSLGSAAVSLCYVAIGWIDAYQCDGLQPWDVAAGVVIVREAKGFVCDTKGGKFNVMQPNFVAAASEELASQYVEVMKKADDELKSR